MIKQIQLKGISREPSDRMAADGGCSESLNVTLENTELAPTLAPRNVTGQKIGSGALSNTTDKYIYIHQVGSADNFIALANGTTFYAYVNGVRSSAIFALSNETYKGCTSVGNTLIISTDKHMHYVLYKGGTYTHLGTRIPEPQVEFKAIPVERTSEEIEDRQRSLLPIITYNEKAAVLEAMQWTAEAWNEVAKKYGTEDAFPSILVPGVKFSEIIDFTSGYLWKELQEIINEDRSQGIFTAPIFARYAIKLYDGSYIYQSVPYLLHSGKNQFLNVYGINWTSDSEREVTDKIFQLELDEYKVEAVVNWNCEGWEDIVRNVDLFLSTDICNPHMNARVNGGFETAVSGAYFALKFLGQNGHNSIDDARDEILGKVNFYKVDSKEPKEIGDGLTIDIQAYTQDDLVVKETLPDDNLSHHETIALGEIMSYNQRIGLPGVKIGLTSNYPFQQSCVFGSTAVTNDRQLYVYYIRTDGGEEKTVISRNPEGGTLLPTPTYTNEDEETLYGTPKGWLYYPDPRCFKCELYVGTSTGPVNKYTIPMKEHPGLNGSYYLCGLNLALYQHILPDDTDPTSYPSSEDSLFEEANKYIMSDPVNPWVLPLSNRATFTDGIVGAATTTKALSSGQFGQFPLYIFTRGGIWALPITDTGALSAPVPLSRDVAVSADGITPIDQAIVYVTVRGVMLLTGSDIQDLTPYMNGPHYVLEEEASDLLAETVWEDLIPVVTDTTPFNQFMAGSKCIYDYAGQRLIFYNTSLAATKQYQYILQLSGSVWQKQSLIPAGVTIQNKLNSYPDSLVCCTLNNVYTVHDFANVYDPSMAQATLPGMIITRGINLDQSFVRKSVTDLKIRGYIDRDSEADKIKYILLGSSDGINYGLVQSLRGSSYKFHRLVILTNLDADERISWVDMEYDPRLNNKLR